MAEERSHVHPLAPAMTRYGSEEEWATTPTGPQSKELRRRRRKIECCGVITAIILLQIVIVSVLALTVFRFKDPYVKLNMVTFQSINFFPGASPNATLTAEIAIKNKNWGEFKFEASTITFSYRGTTVGEAQIPKGPVKMRRTRRMSITVEMKWDQVFGVKSFGSDFSSGILTLNSQTRLSGKVKMMMVFKGSRTGKMNCTMTINATTQAIQDLLCNR